MAPKPITCETCDCKAELLPAGHVVRLASGKEYLFHFPVWYCYGCDGWVKVYPNSPDAKPMGIIATDAVRAIQHKALIIFTSLWKAEQYRREELGLPGSKKVRRLAHEWLAQAIELPTENLNFGFMDEEQCQAAIEICNAYSPPFMRH